MVISGFPACKLHAMITYTSLADKPLQKISDSKRQNLLSLGMYPHIPLSHVGRHSHGNFVDQNKFLYIIN